MLYIFDKNEQLVAILANEADACPYTDAVHTEKLNQENTFSFSIPADRPESSFVKEGAFVAFRDPDLYWQMFEIQKVIDIHNDSGIVRQVYAEHVFCELLNDIIEDIRPYNTTVQAALTAALANTRWQPGIVYDFGTNSVNFYYESALSALQKIVNTWGGELRFRIEITDNVITGRYVDILNRRGEDTGKSFEYTKDIVEIQREVDISSVYTAAYGRGKGIEVETTAGDESYGRRLTFADVVWSTANGDPVDKPAGQEWVGDPDALAQWGRNGRHRFGIYLDSDETDPAALLQKTWEYVQEHKNPLITYSLSVLDLERLSGYNHEAVRLGDTVYVRDKDLNLDVAARVIEIDRDLLLPENTKIVLGNFRPNIADDAVIQAQINRTVSDRQGIWDRATAFGTNGKLSTEWLEGIINTLQNQVNAGAGTVTITNDNGILIVDNAENPTAALRLLGGVFAIANTKNPDGTWNWRTFGTGDGFVADEINSGKIRTALVNIFGDTNFYWDADGIKATNPNDPNQWIKFNKDGLFFTKDGGQTYDFSISWSGLYLGTITKEQLSQEIQDAINKKPVIIDDATTAYFPFDGSLESTRGIQPSFSRGSVAYKSDGTQVAANMPRFETGKFGQAVMVEEGTTNKIETEGGGASKDWSKWSHWGNRSYWQSETQYDDPVMGKVFQGVCNNPTYLFDYYPYSITQDVVYTATIWLKASVAVSGLSAKAYFLNSSGSILGSTTKTINLTTEWQKFEWQITATATATVGFGIGPLYIPAGTTVYAARPQLEQKPYATSFIDGTRAAETLTIPTAGVFPDINNFTIELWAKAQTIKTDTWQGIWGGRGILGAPPVDLMIATENQLYLYYYNSAGTNTSLATGYYISDRTNWHYYAVTFCNGTVRIYVDGIKVKEANITLAQTTGNGNLYIGRSIVKTEYWNGLIDDLRISSRARTDEEIAEYYNSKLPFLDIYAANQAVKSGVSYNNVEISPTVGVRATHATGEYTQLSGDGLKHFYPNPIYTEIPTGVPNTEGFESGTLPSNFSGSGISVTTAAKRSGNYGLQMNVSSSNVYARATFTVTQNNTTVSFWYKLSASGVGDLAVALDGVYKGTLSATTWTQFTITGVNKGKHELTIHWYDGGSTGYAYFDDFIFEQNPVTRTISGYNPSIGQNHVYGIYLGEASSSFRRIESDTPSGVPNTWVHLPEYFKGKNLQIFLSLKSFDWTAQVRGICLKLVEIDNTIPAFCVSAYVQSSITKYNRTYGLYYEYFIAGIDFTYMVIVRD